MSEIITFSAGGNKPDGLKIGELGEKIAFLGATPIVKREGSSSNQDAVAATAATNSSPYGFSEAQANQIIALLNEIRATLVAYGLISGADAP